MKKYKILWVDDEIELLRSHILFLSEKEYEVQTATNGFDALASVEKNNFDLIFLDEMMPGMEGLETLGKIKEINPNIPCVMVTKNEAESLMNDAIGSKISDYLIKPVVPSQMLMVCKKILESKKISEEYVTKDYLSDFNKITGRLLENPDYKDWIDIYLKLVNWDLELDEYREVGLRETLNQQRKECNQEFAKFYDRNYRDWVNNKFDDAPILSPQVLDKFVAKEIRSNDGPIFFFVIDCLRLDQWLVMEQHLNKIFNIKKDYYYSIVPTATAYARNAIFAGLYPSEIEERYPQYWEDDNYDEKSMNKSEKELLQEYINRNKIKLRKELKYLKIIDPEVGKSFEQNIISHTKTHFFAIVINFLDMVAHGRTDSNLLKEIAPDEAAYRSLTNSWFIHSSLYNTFLAISKMKNAKIFITTDHGSVRCMRAAKVLGDKEASKNLRFKFGRNLNVENKYAMHITNPKEYKLPKKKVTTNYIIAKEDYYFIYPTEYNKFMHYFKDTFQHGGISMEEVIIPFVTMEVK